MKVHYISYIGLTIIFICLYVLYLKKEGYSNYKTGNDVGFIVTRCVRKPEHNMLYQDCYAAIRKFHPDLKIVFIDDNSDKTILEEIPMVNVEIIQSEYPAAGEFLPYYYLLTRRLFSKAIIMQDSMILNTRIPYETVDDYIFFYYGLYGKNEIHPMVKELLRTTKIPDTLKDFYNNESSPQSCWGTCSIMTLNFLQEIEDKVGILQWKSQINNRGYRMALESAMGLICTYLKRKSPSSIFGYFDDWPIVKDHGNENYRIKNYLEDRMNIKEGNSKYSIIKVWNTR